MFKIQGAPWVLQLNIQDVPCIQFYNIMNASLILLPNI